MAPMTPSLNLGSPLGANPTKKKKPLDLCLRFLDGRVKQKYLDFIHERSLSIIKILDILIILGSFTMIIYFLISLTQKTGYESLSFKDTLIVSCVSFMIILSFIGFSIWLHYFKHSYSDILLCIINTFSIVFLFEINLNSPHLKEEPTLYFCYSHRFGLMNLMFIFCYKNWFMKVFQVCFGSIYFQIRLPYLDIYTVAYNMVLTAFCCFLFYFLEKQDKLAFKKTLESEKQNRSWKKILNFFPEGIAISKDDKTLVFSNQSLKQILNENDEEKLKQVLFHQIKRKNQNTSYSKFSSETDPSGNLIIKPNNREVSLLEILEAYINKINAGISSEKLERRKSFRKTYITQISMKVQKPEKTKFEVFLSKFNEKFLEIKISKFAYETSNHSFIIIISDVSENMKLRMLEDNKAFKNSLFASFTHEFRTPLNAFFLLSKSLLLQKSISDEIKTEIIDPIVFNAEILHNLINTISDFVTINMQTFKLQKTVLHFKKFMSENTRILNCLAKPRNLTTELKLGSSLPDEVYTDENRIKQILFQFYSNALKFTTSGCIKVSAKVSKTNPDRIIISVKDTGIGMGEKDMANLFKTINQEIDYINYERVSGSAGASLGLTVSNQIARRLDKKPSPGIMFKSQIGKGTKFFFGIKNAQSSRKVSYLNLLRLSRNVSSKKESTLLRNFNLKIEQSDFNYTDDECMNRSNRNKVYNFPEIKLISSSINLSNESKLFATGNQLPKISVVCDHEPILVVDDDEFNIMAVKMLLKLRNLTCMAARNGEKALELIEDQCNLRKNCCKRFGLILMDLNMPVMNGIEASKRLHLKFEDESLPWMPIVICTAYGNDEALAEKFDSGIVEVIHKPLKFDVLESVVAKWMNAV